MRCLQVFICTIFVCFLPAQDSPDEYATGDLRNLLALNSNSHFVIPAYRDLPAWQARKTRIREQILTSAGLYPLPVKSPLAARRFDRKPLGGFAVEKVTLEALPGFKLGGNLYLPHTVQEKLPAVLLAHGHWKHGRIHHADDYSVPALAATLAANGYVVFAYDMIGYNDTRQISHKFGDSKAEMLWAFGPMGLQLWNSIRALDFLASLPEVDPKRIGMTGTSGGGTQTLLLSAVDDRIQSAAPGGMVSAIFQGDDGCEEAAGLHIGLSSVEIAATMAPRPLLLVSATRDWTRNTPTEELPAIESIYRLYGKPDSIENAHIDAGHNCNRDSRRAIRAFFDRTLRGVSFVDAPEVDLSSVNLEDLLIGAKPKDERELVFARWRFQTLLQAATLSDEVNRARLRLILGLESRRTRLITLPAGDRLLLEHVDSGERVLASWHPGRAEGIAIVVHSGGIRQAMSSPASNRLRALGRSILFVQLYRPDPRRARITNSRHELSFRRSDDANRVRDLVAAIRYAAQQRRPAQDKLQLVCLGDASPWCLAAAAASTDEVELQADLENLLPDDNTLAHRLFLPGLQRVGGVPVLKKLARVN